MSNRSRPYYVSPRSEYPKPQPWGHQNAQERGMARRYAMNKGEATKRLNQACYVRSCADAFAARAPEETKAHMEMLASLAAEEHKSAKQDHHKNWK